MIQIDNDLDKKKICFVSGNLFNLDTKYTEIGLFSQ